MSFANILVGAWTSFVGDPAQQEMELRERDARATEAAHNLKLLTTVAFTESGNPCLVLERASGMLVAKYSTTFDLEISDQDRASADTPYDRYTATVEIPVKSDGSVESLGYSLWGDILYRENRDYARQGLFDNLFDRDLVGKQNGVTYAFLRRCAAELKADVDSFFEKLNSSRTQLAEALRRMPTDPQTASSSHENMTCSLEKNEERGTITLSIKTGDPSQKSSSCVRVVLDNAGNILSAEFPTPPNYTRTDGRMSAVERHEIKLFSTQNPIETIMNGGECHFDYAASRKYLISLYELVISTVNNFGSRAPDWERTVSAYRGVMRTHHAEPHSPKLKQIENIFMEAADKITDRFGRDRQVS